MNNIFLLELVDRGVTVDLVDSGVAVELVDGGVTVELVDSGVAVELVDSSVTVELVDSGVTVFQTVFHLELNNMHYENKLSVSKFCTISTSPLPIGVFSTICL